jgi:hypothetical protein
MIILRRAGGNHGWRPSDAWIEESIMARYQVKLYKDLLSSDGHPFHCLQSITDVDADGPDIAVKLVLHEMNAKACDWSISVGPCPGRELESTELAA